MCYQHVLGLVVAQWLSICNMSFGGLGSNLMYGFSDLPPK